MRSRPIRAAALTMSSGSPSSIASIGFSASTFDEIEGWRDDDQAAAFKAFRSSCDAAMARAESACSGSTAARLGPICRQAKARGNRRIGTSEARGFFERWFVPHRVHHAAPNGLLTGFYEPVYEASTVRTARFCVPLYRRPDDLTNVIDDSGRARADVPLTHLRRTIVGLVPFPTRTEIEEGALAGQGLELMWLADPVDAFFGQVQGSLRVRLPDGRMVGLTYDGKNGHPYSSVGRLLIDRGIMSADEMTLDRLGMWLRADEVRGREAMRHNRSFVFFREIGEAEGTSALGVLGTPLMTGRSLAIDTAFHALGLPVFVDAPTLRHWGRRAPFRRLMVTHDVGSAIRGPERGDIYFGSGEAAGKRAGITKHPGTFHVLLPRGSDAAGGRRAR